jgi:hypothetical protein
MQGYNGKHWKTAAGATGLAALLFTVGCGARDAQSTLNAQQLPAAQAGTPVVVSCEPHQRTIVRPTVVNGTAVSQVECVAAQPGYAPQAYAAPAAATAYAPAPRTVYTDGGYAPTGETRIVREPAPTRTVARPVRTSQVVYDEVPVRKTRSVKKSAIIIGSSAGVGAGVGAAVGGKKGALIGAAIGGGSAAIWDQVTRR